jgi:small nuclear ribonucleoprotein (snRNP)-like protein
MAGVCLAICTAESPRSHRNQGRGGGPSRGGKTGTDDKDRPKRQAILDLAKYVDHRVRVKFTGGREGASRRVLTAVSRQPGLTVLQRTVRGTLKGYDQLLNLVMDDVEELVRGKPLQTRYYWDARDQPAAGLQTQRRFSLSSPKRLANSAWSCSEGQPSSSSIQSRGQSVHRGYKCNPR